MAGKTYSFTRAQLLTGVAVIISLVAIILPRAVEATTGTLTTIVDPVTAANKAKVDAAGRLQTAACDNNDCAVVDTGKLRVGDGSGPITVDGKVQLVPTTPYAISMSGSAADGFIYPQASATTPAGKRFVIESVSLDIDLPNGQGLWWANMVFYTGGHGLNLRVHPTYLGTYAGSDHYTVAQALKVYADASSTVSCSGGRTSTAGSASIHCDFAGYLA